MEENFYHNDFEELIKGKADQYKMYPSEKVWKRIDRSLRTRRRWYWSGFVVLLSGISYLAITELMSPATPSATNINAAPVKAVEPINPQQLLPFSSELPVSEDPADKIISDVTVEDSGALTASFEIPLKLIDFGRFTSDPNQKTSLLITGLEPLKKHEVYNIELSWPVIDDLSPAGFNTSPATEKRLPVELNSTTPEEKKNSINWLQEQAALRPSAAKTRRISWQLAFSPTMNYRKLRGSKNARVAYGAGNVPVAVSIEGDVDKFVNHKPALGFELGSHGLLSLSNRVTLKGGLQFNYSKYDIRAFRAPAEYATIALNSTTGGPGSSLVSYTNLRNFGGSSVEDLKNQYFQISLPVGLELRLLGNDRLQVNIASTIQPTYMLNSNSYLITTDYKNYTREPSLVRRWNVNAGAEAFVSYNRGGVKWQVGPQFRYQLLSSYENVYPIKEYLMEYGIKIGITKTIR